MWEEVRTTESAWRACESHSQGKEHGVSAETASEEEETVRERVARSSEEGVREKVRARELQETPSEEN